MPSIRTVGWSWQEAHTVIFGEADATRTMSVWEYVTIYTLIRPNPVNFPLFAGISHLVVAYGFRQPFKTLLHPYSSLQLS
ncbi:hypothetical protein [Moorena producens]|uniref:hypothetical protein n=1 Tax=Moorena producens TaxID=1155739 RepID=UPI003C72B5F3